MSLNQSEIVTQINHLGASNSAELMKLAAQFAKKKRIKYISHEDRNYR
ncbi:hypothetical protein [Amylolactobacillus amylophilus]|nr:hypothetical protein [Amylolactobacillus amylophilus]